MSRLDGSQTMAGQWPCHCLSHPCRVKSSLKSFSCRVALAKPPRFCLSCAGRHWPCAHVCNCMQVNAPVCNSACHQAPDFLLSHGSMDICDINGRTLKLAIHGQVWLPWQPHATRCLCHPIMTSCSAHQLDCSVVSTNTEALRFRVYQGLRKFGCCGIYMA